jgi:hypothetical protein
MMETWGHYSDIGLGLGESPERGEKYSREFDSEPPKSSWVELGKKYPN